MNDELCLRRSGTSPIWSSRIGTHWFDSPEVPRGLAGGVTPVPIPNTEVKPSKADDTAAVRQWDSRTLPGYKKSLLEKSGRLFYLSLNLRMSN